MIRVRKEDGSTARIFDLKDQVEILYRRELGFVGKSSLTSRNRMRLASGLKPADKEPDFSFQVQSKNNKFEIIDGENCTFKRDGEAWVLDSGLGRFRLEDAAAGHGLNLPPLPVQKAAIPRKSIASIVLMLLLLSGVLFIGLLWNKDQGPLEAKQDQEEIAPVVIDMAKKVEPPKPVVQPKAHQAIDKTVKAQRALTQTLGFLGVVGRKDLTKALGGLPTKTAQATAGAGPGGNQGSGGELLVGLGEGIRHTTVGNSGMAGLGGIGTKGAGGGLGGYGDTAMGSGAGKSLSSVPLSQDAVIDGGLDRSLIQATILRYLSQVRACYEEGLKRKADLIGQVTMNFEINGGGGVNYSRVGRSSLSDREVEECIGTKMLGWKFPSPKGGVLVKVSYPFMLRPVGT